MHSLRPAYRRALQGTVCMQKNPAGFDRVYNTESTPCAPIRKNKEERLKLVLQFLAKYKDANKGQLPGISVLRKEVGGKYEILKDILHEIKNNQAETKMEMPASGTRGSPQALGYSCKRQPLPAEVFEEEKKLPSQVGRTMKIKKDDDITNSRIVSNSVERRELSMTSGKDVSQSIMDISVGIDKDGTDSDATAPEHQCLPLPQMEHSLKRACKIMKPIEEFCLFITKVPASTTSADLRAAFEDCGEIFNASVLHVQHLSRPIKANYFCATVTFKTEEGLKSAKMKERVVLRGQVIDLKLDWNDHTVTKMKQASSQCNANKNKGQQSRPVHSTVLTRPKHSKAG